MLQYRRNKGKIVLKGPEIKAATQVIYTLTIGEQSWQLPGPIGDRLEVVPSDLGMLEFQDGIYEFTLDLIQGQMGIQYEHWLFIHFEGDRKIMLDPECNSDAWMVREALLIAECDQHSDCQDYNMDDIYMLFQRWVELSNEGCDNYKLMLESDGCGSC